MRKINLQAVLVGVSAIMSFGAAHAAMAPAVFQNSPKVLQVDCAAGFHLGPIGTCIIGTDDRAAPPPVVEHRATDEGCETKSVKRTDEAGNSETRTATNCN